MYVADLNLQTLTEFEQLGAEGRARQIIVLRAFLEAMSVANWQYLQRFPMTPRLYERAPAYSLKTRAGERDSWQDLPATYAAGVGDCKDLSCIRVAELRNEGRMNAVPFIRIATYHDPDGTRRPLTVFHVQVSYGGKIEDPSKRLGMPSTVSYRELHTAPDAAGITSARWGALDWTRAAT